MKKILLKSLTILFILTMVLNTVFAALGEDTSQLNVVTQTDNNITNKFEKAFNNITHTILYILQVLTVGGLVYTGVKYMYAGPQDKGQIKQSLIYMIIGTVLVFGIRIVVDLVSGTFNTIT